MTLGGNWTKEAGATRKAQYHGSEIVAEYIGHDEFMFYVESLDCYFDSMEEARAAIDFNKGGNNE